MQLSGKRRDSVMNPAAKPSETTTIEDEHLHSENDDRSCAGKVKLTREERLAIWKAEKQSTLKPVRQNALASKKKSGLSDHRLKDLSSSQLNRCTSAFLTSELNPNSSSSHTSKRHCSRSSKRRESHIPGNPDHHDFPVDGVDAGSFQKESKLPEDSKSALEVVTIQPESEFFMSGPAAIPAEEYQIIESPSHEGQEEPSIEILKQQLYDQNNRLIQCSSLLKRLLEENQELQTKLSEHHLLKDRCAKLENTIAEVSLLYQLSQMTSSTQSGAESEDVKQGAARTNFLEESAVTKDREISRLRGRLFNSETEFKAECERLVGKLLTAEEGRRAAEAASKENDAMWEQLFSSKISELQAKCADALQLRALHTPKEQAEESSILQEYCAQTPSLQVLLSDGPGLEGAASSAAADIDD